LVPHPFLQLEANMRVGRKKGGREGGESQASPLPGFLKKKKPN
jgi:hypothetical protein